MMQTENTVQLDTLQNCRAEILQRKAELNKNYKIVKSELDRKKFKAYKYFKILTYVMYVIFVLMIVTGLILFFHYSKLRGNAWVHWSILILPATLGVCGLWYWICAQIIVFFATTFDFHIVEKLEWNEQKLQQNIEVYNSQLETIDKEIDMLK